MKITANRKDELIRKRAEYDAETRRLKDREEEAERRLRDVQYEIGEGISNQIRNLIGDTTLNLGINASPYGRYGSPYYSIRISANESNKFDDDVALAWSWETSLDDEGNAVSESSSWSGLSATTPAQLADLKESVRVIELLNNIDWPSVLVEAPKYSDYADKEATALRREREQARPHFEDDLLQAMLQDAVDDRTVIHLDGRPESAYYREQRHRDYWATIEKVSPKFVTVRISHTADMKDAREDERISIDKFVRFIDDPKFDGWRR